MAILQSTGEPSDLTLAAAEALAAAGQLTQEQLTGALAYARQWHAQLPDVLSSLYNISGLTWARVRAATAGLPLADLMADPPDGNLILVADRAACPAGSSSSRRAIPMIRKSPG